MLSCSKKPHAANLSSCALSFYLLNIEFIVDCSILFKQFIMNNLFPVPLYTQHHFMQIKKIVSCTVLLVYWG